MNFRAETSYLKIDRQDPKHFVLMILVQNVWRFKAFIDLFWEGKFPLRAPKTAGGHGKGSKKE